MTLYIQTLDSKSALKLIIRTLFSDKVIIDKTDNFFQTFVIGADAVVIISQALKALTGKDNLPLHPIDVLKNNRNIFEFYGITFDEKFLINFGTFKYNDISSEFRFTSILNSI